jgi:RNA polymerase sigma-70 factor (ECF subfamily)
MSDLSSSEVKAGLHQITTRWTVLKEPAQFLMRYGPAIRNYLGAILKNPHDADEVAQDILVRVVQDGFHRASPDRGRFRDYLKVSVRNAALTHLRRKQPLQPGDQLLTQVADDDAPEQAWLADWQRCVLNKAWRALDQHERGSAGNLYYTVLRMAVDFPDDDSRQLADRVAKAIGRPFRPEAFRKQLSRARRHFAQLLLDEVTSTLDNPTPEQIEEELIDLGLMEYLRDFLPDDWRQRGTLLDSE